MQSRKDGALRKIVEDGRLPMKTRRAALAEMDRPSRLFLTRLANDHDVPAKLRLDAARRLPETERRISGERARRPEPDEEAKRREIDAILAECAREQTPNIEGPKPIPESSERVAVESQPLAPEVPQNEISSPVNWTDERAEELKHGHELSAAILRQLEIMSHAPLNWHAGQKKLEQLQADFLAWERAMHTDYPDIDTRKEFPDARLRPPQRIIDARTYQAHRRVMTLDDALAVPLAEAKSTHDYGFWGGLPGRI
jgi:hypothetical protein